MKQRQFQFRRKMIIVRMKNTAAMARHSAKNILEQFVDENSNIQASDSVFLLILDMKLLRFS